MPNWCYTDISIHGPENEITLLWNHIQTATTKENGEHDYCLGNIVAYLGYPYEDIPCRGHIINMELIGKKQIAIQTEDAWCPQFAPIVLLVEKYAPGSEFLFSAEEPGCDLFASNDPSVVGQWLVEVWEVYDGLPEEFNNLYELFSPQELKEVLQKWLQINGNIEDLVAKAESKYEYIRFHQFEEADVHDFY